ncbi:hypothetical protein SNEBB_006843 [Seison nebaliae]|nr:hypothetical protein SNEBB_006843 [Seison nebaliae]
MDRRENDTKIYVDRLHVVLNCAILGLLSVSIFLAIFQTQQKERTYDPNTPQFYILEVTDGTYELGVKYNSSYHEIWFKSHDPFITINHQKCSVTSGCLILVGGSSSTSGIDVFGQWQNSIYTYYVNGTGELFKVEFRTYPYREFMIFRQHIVEDMVNCSTGDVESIVTGYPSFSVEKGENDKGVLSYGGQMSGDVMKKINKWEPKDYLINSGMLGGLFTVFQMDMDNSIVFSPLDHFPSSSVEYKQNGGNYSFAFGVMGGAEKINMPDEYSYLVSFSPYGINDAISRHGKIIQKYHNGQKFHDPLLDFIGYYTDNGAYYYYNAVGTTYDNILNQIKKKFNFFSYQIDSWWYKKDAANIATISWSPDNNVFSDSIVDFAEELDRPIIAHNKMWSYDVVYASYNGGMFPFFPDKLSGLSLPATQDFWDWLFAYGKKWKLATYEQDWMNHQTMDFTPLKTNINLGENWLSQMNIGAKKFNISIQYCMALPRHTMEAVRQSQVTHVRVSDDYATSLKFKFPQWKIGITSIFVLSLGLRPHKDTFWSTKSEPGNPKYANNREISPGAELTISVITGSPVVPGDAINKIDKELLSTSSRNDQRVLRLTKHATATDHQIKEMVSDFNWGELWFGYSQYVDQFFGLVFCAEIPQATVVNFDKLLINSNNHIIYQMIPTLKIFENITDIHEYVIDNCTSKEDYRTILTAPQYLRPDKTSVYLLGEKDKIVPFSTDRFRIKVIKSGIIDFIEVIGGTMDETIVVYLYINQQIEKRVVMMEANSTNELDLIFVCQLKNFCRLPEAKILELSSSFKPLNLKSLGN